MEIQVKIVTILDQQPIKEWKKLVLHRVCQKHISALQGNPFLLKTVPMPNDSYAHIKPIS